MTNNEPKPDASDNTSSDEFARQVSTKARRKLKVRRNPAPGVWFGLGMMGLIGWSIVVPTLIGAALGIWLDKHYTSQHSWALALLMAGLTLGSFNAWRWVQQQDKAMREEQDDGNDDDRDASQ